MDDCVERSVLSVKLVKTKTVRIKSLFSSKEESFQVIKYPSYIKSQRI